MGGRIFDGMRRPTHRELASRLNANRWCNKSSAPTSLSSFLFSLSFVSSLSPFKFSLSISCSISLSLWSLVSFQFQFQFCIFLYVPKWKDKRRNFLPFSRPLLNKNDDYLLFFLYFVIISFFISLNFMLFYYHDCYCYYYYYCHYDWLTVIIVIVMLVSVLGRVNNSVHFFFHVDRFYCSGDFPVLVSFLLHFVVFFPFKNQRCLISTYHHHRHHLQFTRKKCNNLV